MNTSTNTLTCQSVSYGEQINKQFEQLNFTQDYYLNLFCLELEFENTDQQKHFMQFKEQELANNLQISCCFTNPYLKPADFMVLTKREEFIEYQIYITFERQSWMYDIALEHACSKLLKILSQQDVIGKIELVEQFGVYLSVHFEFPATSTIEQRLEHIFLNFNNKLDFICNKVEKK